MICKYCGERLKFKRGIGWTHSDGKVYRMKLDYQRICLCGNILKEGYCSRCQKQYKKVWKDDHCAFPIREEVKKDEYILFNEK